MYNRIKSVTFVEMSKKIMTKNTDKQAIDNLADNFNGYAA